MVLKHIIYITFFSVSLLLLGSFPAHAAGEVNVTLSTNTSSYENGGLLQYQITVKNNTGNMLTDVSVSSPVASLTANSESGTLPAFSASTITSSSSWGSDAGIFVAKNADLDATSVDLFPFASVTYVVDVVVANDIIGSIDLGEATVEADIDKDGITEAFHSPSGVVVPPAPYEYSVTLTSDSSQYQTGGNLTYTLTIENTGSYKIQHLSVFQPFESVTAEAVDSDTSAAFQSVSISGSKSGSDSDLGDYSLSGDLTVENATVAVGGRLVYTIATVVSSDLIGDISTQAVVSTPQGDVNSDWLTVPPTQADIHLTHTLNTTLPYLVNDEMVFDVSVNNTGKGIAHHYQVEQNIADLVSNLGLANNLGSEYNHTDISGNPYASWTVSVVDAGEHSQSDIQDSGAITNSPFIDQITLFPNESIDYQVVATLSPVAIGAIQGFNAKVLNSDGAVVQDEQVSTVLSAERVLSVADSEISIEKMTSASQYVPSGTVEYEIEVSNQSSKYFANNLQVVDDLTCVKTDQADGAGEGQAFSRWKLDVVSGEDSVGSDPGTFNYGSWTTAPITLSPDIAPGKTVHYRLTAEVSPTSIGTILDNQSGCSDNVVETGSGIQMPDDKLRVSKDVDIRYYSPSDEVTYSIRVDNDGDGFSNQIRVFDDLPNIQTDSVTGGSVAAYSSWAVTATAYHQDGSAALSTNTGISGSLVSPDALDVTATIEPHSYIIYTVVATINPYANGHIQNSVLVDGSAYADRGIDPRDFTVELNKTVKTNSDANFRDGFTSYGKQENQITYQIHVANPVGNGFATNVEVKDDITSVTTSLLEPDNQSKPVFSSWTISAEVVTDEPALIPYTDVGSFNDNQNLDTIAQIPPNVEVVYTIVADIDRSVDSDIVYDSFANTATVVTPDSNSQSSLSDTVVVHPRSPDVVVVKISDTESFKPGEWVDFDITVFNRGEGFANEVHVYDDVVGMDAFSEWTITAETDHHTSPFATGSYAGPKSGYSDNGNIDAYIDIDPKTEQGFGKVNFHIHGLVKEDYAKPEISNTVEVYDPVNALNTSATAQVGEEAESLNVSIVKTANSHYFTPGQDSIYTIVVLNNSKQTVGGLKLVDPLQAIKSVLANDKDGHHAELEDQSPFEYWQFDYGDGSGWGAETTENLIYPLNSGETFTLAAGEQRAFKIKVKVKDNVVGTRDTGSHVLKEIIKNDAYIYQNFELVNQKSHVSHYEMRKTNNGASVERTLLVNGKESRFYAPGDVLTYKVKHRSNVGYANNRTVSEDIEGVSVLLSNGETGQAFSNTFDVSVSKEDSNGGEGTTDGTLDGTVENNKNINTVIDIAGQDSVTYVVEGTVRDDAVGDITIGGITITPYDYHLTFSKTVDQPSYQPNENLTYHLTVVNDGKGPAYNIPIEDSLSSVTVELLDGSTGKAYQPGWTIDTEVTSDSTATIVDLDHSLQDGKNIHTHFSLAAGESIDYIVTVKVNPSAVGDIYNYLNVDGDYVSSKLTSDTQKYDFSKKIIEYLDTDGTSELSGGYTPGGYIVYQIALVNDSNVHIDSMAITDDIAGISTDYFDGTSGPAFTEWTIEASADDSGLSDTGVVKDNTNINTEFDVAATNFATSDTYVRYVIKAKVSEKAVGDIQNIAYVDGTHRLTSERASMLKANVAKLHKAYTDPSFSTPKTTYSIDDDQRPVVYHLHLENSGKGTEYGASLVESFSEIKTKLAQNAKGEVDDQTGAVYVPENWSVSVTHSDELTTDIGDYVGGTNVDIDIPVLSIAPNGWVDIVVESAIRDDSMTQIQVTPKYRGSNFGKSTLSALGAKLLVDKTIVSIGGKPYSTGDVYRAGQEVVYRFSVSNTESVWFDNAILKDLLSDIKVEVLGGGVQPAFENTSITHTISTGIDSDVDTYLPDYDATGDLNITADIAPGESIVFTIKGIIRGDALGDIDVNRAVGGNQTVTTEMIPSVAPDIQFDKRVLNTTADHNTCTFPSSTGNGCLYNPGGQVSYQITVSNQGEGIANDVTVVDRLNDIVTSNGDNAFSSLSTTITEQPNESRFSISGSYSGNVPLDATMDLMPGDQVVFVLTGNVDDSAMGDITNIATVDEQESNAVTLLQGQADIVANKSTSTPTYAPGGEVHYTMYVANTSESNASIQIVDEISKFTVETVDGSQQTALANWSISSQFVSNTDATYNDNSNIPSSGDIKAEVHLGHAVDGEPTVLKIDVVGQVRNDAVGKFGNVLYVDSKQFDLQQQFIYPEPGALNVSKTASSSPATYAPGDTIGFDIVVENTGSGYLKNLQISDLTKSIKADVVNSTTQAQVIPQWESATSYLTITDATDSHTVTLAQTTFDDVDGFVGQYHLAPGAKIDLHLEGEVVSEATGAITNKVTVSADNIDTQTDSATYNPIDASITLSKTVDKAVYQTGDMLTYTITLTNTTRAWATEVHLQDYVDRITAESIFGGTVTAFEDGSISISATSLTGETRLPSLSQTYLDHNLDIAPSDVITVTMSGKLKPEIIGDVTNTATAAFESNTLESSATSTPLVPTLSISKTPIHRYYAPGTTNGFVITIENQSASYANDVVIEDLISELKVDTLDGNQGQSFSRWSQTVEAGSSATYIDSSAGWNEDVQYSVDLAPNDTLTITVEGEVNAQATGTIPNTATMTFNGIDSTASAILLPLDVSLTLEKYVGETGSETEMAYEPGAESVYRVVVTNTSDAFASTDIEDIISELTVTTIQGYEEAAFSRWSVAVNYSNDLTTIAPNPSGSNKNIDAHVNLAPHDSIEFVITGQTNSLGNSDIKNTASMVYNESSTVERSEIASATLTPAPDEVTITKEADSVIYEPGGEVVYRIKLANAGQGFATQVVVKDVIKSIKVPTIPDITTGNKNVINAFTRWTIEENHSDVRTVVNSSNASENDNINAVLDIAPGDTVEYVITGIVDSRALGEIVNTAYKISAPSDGTRAVGSVETASATITPRSVLFYVDKTTSRGDNADYTKDDDELTYIIQVANLGTSKIVGAQMVDEISKLAGTNGNPLFTSWTSTITEWPSGTIVATLSDQDLNLPNSSLSLDLEPYADNGYEIQITGQLNKGLDDNITNTFTVTDPATGETGSDSVSVHVKKFADNEGELTVSKQALKTDAQVGDVIEYEVVVQNNNESEFKSVKLVDRYPASFQYVEGTAEITNSGPDGVFDTADDVLITHEPVVTDTLSFDIGDMLAHGSSGNTVTEQVRIRYLLRVSVGATFGRYVNTAWALTPMQGSRAGELETKSNTASATVEIKADKLFDTASIIGKVFEDHNRDGYQADATAYNLVVTAQINPSDYIAHSTYVKSGDALRLLKDDDGRTPLVSGIKQKSLLGVSINRTLDQTNKISYLFKTKTRTGFAFNVTSRAGTEIDFDPSGKSNIILSGQRAKGLSTENLNVSRNLYRQGDEYIWEIEIENKGIYEDGIPGVRLLTVEGVVIETDQYGRYHVPDSWVLNNKGKQFLVKLDTDSLPTGMTVFSENPKVKRISPNKLTKFNFSVVTEE